ncbi:MULTISPECIES: glycoside hydrolase family 73 protein [Burkholderia]|uniref:glycoside hydrolase family 73 protein n=1 Tax=Burkholderia TaxID=32008 RepID=UPI00163E3C5E|nr:MULTISPECIES: glucosaminidase domain-containing protein [Burkholderia]
MPNVKIGVDAQLNAQDLDAQLDALKQKINAVGQAIAQANRVSFQPIGKATLADLDRVTRQFESLKRGAPNVAKAIEASGQGGRSFFDIDWERMFSNAIAREAARYGAFSKVTAGTGAGFVQPAARPSPGASPASASPASGPTPSRSAARPASQWWNGRYSNPWNHTRVGGIVSAGLNAAGPVGSVASSALNSAYVGGGGSFLSGGALMAGFGGLLGGGLALGVSKLIGGVMSKVGDAQQENMAIDALKRQVGDVGVSFDALEASLRGAAGAIDVTINEAGKFGSEFAKLGNVSERDYDKLADSVQFAGAFSRSFGLDPSAGVGFFGQMRGVGVTRNVADDQKLGLTIGEAIAKSRAFSQSDRVLQAIANFATQQTRLGLTAANTTGYAGALAGLAGAGVPGLDVQGAASILDRVNSSIANAGNGNPAWQSFMYSALGQRLGLDPIQTMMLEESGAFGSGAATFGKGSLFERWAKQNGIAVPGAAAGSNETNLGAVMRRLRQVYSGSGMMSELRVNAMAQQFHLSNSQAMALDSIGPQRVDTLLPWLQRLGIDPSKVNYTGLSALAQIHDNGSLTDQQKVDQARGVAANGQEKDQGTEVRDAVVGTQNALQTYADKAVPLMTSMTDSLLALAGKSAGHMMTPAELHQMVLDGQRKEVGDKADTRIAKARAQFVAASSVDDFGRPIDPAGQKAAWDNLQSETKAANDDREAGLAKISAGDLKISPTLAARAGDDAVRAAIADQQKYGVPASVTLAQYALESGYGKSGLAKRSNNPFGIQYRGNGKEGGDFVYGDDQHADGTHYRARFKKYMSIADAFDDHARLLSTNPAYAKAREHLNNPDAYADALTGTYAEDRGYGGKLKSIMHQGMYATPMPDGAPVQTTQHNVSGSMSGTFYLNYPDGKPAAAPVQVQTTVAAPQAAGSH